MAMELLGGEMQTGAPETGMADFMGKLSEVPAATMEGQQSEVQKQGMTQRRSPV